MRRRQKGGLSPRQGEIILKWMAGGFDVLLYLVLAAALGALMKAAIEVVILVLTAYDEPRAWHWLVVIAGMAVGGLAEGIRTAVAGMRRSSNERHAYLVWMGTILGIAIDFMALLTAMLVWLWIWQDAQALGGLTKIAPESLVARYWIIGGSIGGLTLGHIYVALILRKFS